MLALIAGEGALPAAVASAQAEPPLVAALEGFWPEGLTPDADLIWRVETMGTLLARLRDKGVTEVCLCGAVDRPAVDLSAIDDATKPLIPVMQKALSGLGDDGVLRAVMAIFEDAGFTVRAAHEAAPSLLPKAGVLTAAQPSDADASDAAIGDQVSTEQGQHDLGQACVIRDGEVIAREDDGGTNAMLAALDTGTGGMFFKAPKPGQDRRADLPVIGPETARRVAEAGLAGMTIAAGGVMVLERTEVLRICAKNNLYLWVRAS